MSKLWRSRLYCYESVVAHCSNRSNLHTPICAFVWWYDIEKRGPSWHMTLERRNVIKIRSLLCSKWHFVIVLKSSTRLGEGGGGLILIDIHLQHPDISYICGECLNGIIHGLHGFLIAARDAVCDQHFGAIFYITPNVLCWNPCTVRNKKIKGQYHIKYITYMDIMFYRERSVYYRYEIIYSKMAFM